MLLLFACVTPSGGAAGPEPAAEETGPVDTARTDTGGTGADALPTVSVPPGTWTIGSPAGEVGRTDDETAHLVTLSYAFAITTHEVTLGQFRALAGYTPNGDASCGDDCPVRWVDWHEAAAWANARSVRDGLDACYVCEGSGPDVACAPVAGACLGWRLPTEAEWEIAARAGTTGAFPGAGGLVAGTESACDGALALDDGTTLDDLGWYCGNSGDAIHPVGQRAANAWGLHDTVGNVYEWTGDWFAPFDGAEAVDPTGPADGTQRVHKGGGWGSVPSVCRPANRAPTDPTFTSGGLGFRVGRRVE